MIRIIADTANIRQHWEHRCDELPYLMVPMSDGRVIRYNPEIPQTGISQVLEKRSHDLKSIRIGYERKRDK